MITFVLLYMLTDDKEGDGRSQVLLSVLVAALVIAISLVRERMRSKSTEDAVASR